MQIRLRHLVAPVAAMGLAVSGCGPSGELDSTFDEDGVAVTAFADHAYVTDVVVQSDGKVVAVGDLFTGTHDIAIARYGANGALDATYGPARTGKVVVDSPDAPGTYNNAAAAVLQPDDKLVVVGGDASGTTVRRLLTSGSPDPSFGDGGLVRLSAAGGATDVALAPGGKLVVTATTADGGAVYRLAGNGVPDGSFSGDGFLPLSRDAGQLKNAKSVAVDDDGRVLVSGFVNGNCGPSGCMGIARFTTTGGRDATWASGAARILPGVTMGRLRLASTGDAVVTASQVPTAEDPIHVFRLTGAGAFDPGFGDGGIAQVRTGSFNEVSDVAVDRAGHILVGGSSSFRTHRRCAVARLTTAGERDASFGGGDGVGVANLDWPSYCSALGLSPDGRPVLGGATDQNGPDNRFLVERFLG